MAAVCVKQEQAADERSTGPCSACLRCAVEAQGHLPVEMCLDATGLQARLYLEDKTQVGPVVA